VLAAIWSRRKLADFAANASLGRVGRVDEESRNKGPRACFSRIAKVCLAVSPESEPAGQRTQIQGKAARRGW
jgi:hypothetical protein